MSQLGLGAVVRCVLHERHALGGRLQSLRFRHSDFFAPLASTVLPHFLTPERDKRPSGRYRIVIMLFILVAGVGFEPTTFRL